MSSLAVILCSIGVGATFVAFMLITQRHEVGMTGWRRVIWTLCAAALGLGTTTIVGRLTLGAAAMPGWITTVRALWIPVLGIIYLTYPDPERRQLRWFAYPLLAYGIFSMALDIHQFTART